MPTLPPWIQAYDPVEAIKAGQEIAYKRRQMEAATALREHQNALIKWHYANTAALEKKADADRQQRAETAASTAAALQSWRDEGRDIDRSKLDESTRAARQGDLIKSREAIQKAAELAIKQADYTLRATKEARALKNQRSYDPIILKSKLDEAKDLRNEIAKGSLSSGNLSADNVVRQGRLNVLEGEIKTLTTPAVLPAADALRQQGGPFTPPGMSVPEPANASPAASALMMGTNTTSLPDVPALRQQRWQSIMPSPPSGVTTPPLATPTSQSELDMATEALSKGRSYESVAAKYKARTGLDLPGPQ